MAATPDADDDMDIATADERLTAELSRQLALGHDTVTLGVLRRETRLDAARVDEVMSHYERMHNSPIKRTGGTGEDIEWRLREGDVEK